MSVKVADYKGEEIKYDSHGKLFWVQHDKNRLTAPTQKELEKIIDQAIKSERFPIEAIHASYGLVRITSFTKTRSHYGSRYDVWISYPKVPEYEGASKWQRQKVSINNFYLPTEANKAITAQIDEKNAQIDTLRKERDALRKTFESPLTSEEITGTQGQ